MSTLYVNTINPKTGTAVKTGGAISGSSDISIGGNIEYSGSINKVATSGGGHVSSSGDVYALGSVSASNNLAVGGNLHISGTINQATVNSYLTANDEARLKAGATVSGSLVGKSTLIVDDQTSLKAGATVSGSLTGKSTLIVDDQASLKAGATVSGSFHAASVSSSGDIYALGSVSASNNLAVGGNIHASGTITADVLNINEINSTTKTVNTLEIVDKVILAASGTYPNNAGGAGLQIGGHSTGSAGTDVAATFFYNASNNSMDLSTTLSSSGDLYALGSISSSNNLAVGGNLHITGTINQATVNSYLTANDEARLKAGATVSGSLVGKSTLIVDDQTSLKAGATVSGSFHALGNSNLGNAATDVITVAGALTASNGAYIQGQNIVLSGSNGYVNLGGDGSGGNLSLSGSVIAGASKFTQLTINNGTGNDSALILGDGSTNYWQVMYDAANSDANHRFLIYDSASPSVESPFVIEQGAPADSIYADSTGVGIGTGAPGTKLHVVGDSTFAGDTATFSSANTTDPLLVIKNTTNDGYGSRLRFIKDKGAAGAANDEAGVIEFYADDANQDNICFAAVTGSVAVHTNGQEGGKLTLKVASHDGGLAPGLVIVDGDADDEVDVTLGNGTASSTTVAGSATVTTDLSVNGDTTLGNAAGDRTHVTGSFFIKNATYDYYPVNYSHNTDMLQLNGAVFLNYQTTASMGLDVYGSNTLISGSGGFLDLRDAVGNLSLSGSLSMPGFSLSTNDAGTSNTILGSAAGAAVASGCNYNTLVGFEAGNDLSSGDNNVFIGYQAGDNTTDVDSAVIIGHGAGSANMTSAADGTIAIGLSAGAAITSGIGNVAIGAIALDAETDGDYSTAVGYAALTAQTGGGDGVVGNVAVGAAAGYAITSGKMNTAIGSFSMEDATTSDGTTAVGYGALMNQTTNGSTDNVYNTAVGALAGDALTTGIQNVFIGANAGGATVDVDYATIIGYDAGSANMTSAADGTVAIGYSAGRGNASGVGNTAVGFEALKTNEDGDYNTAVGYEALETFEADTDGHGENTALGYHAGKAVSTGTRNTILGAFAGDALQGGDNNTFIGTAAGGATTAASDCVVIGQGAGAANMTADADGTVLVGKGAGAALTSGEDNVAIGKNALASEDDGDGCVAVGFLALGDQTGVTGDVLNTAVGCKAGKDLTTGVKNVFIGHQAGYATTNVDETVIIGQGAGAANMTADADGTIAIGASAGAAITSGIGNTVVGYASLDAEDDGDQNTAIGYKTLAAQTGTTGEVGNTAVGFQAGQFITTATGTTFIGNQCGQGIGATKLTGNNNTGLGSDAGLLLQGAAHSNTYIGATAGDVTTTGVENTCLGFNTDIQDATATNQVVIGNNITGTKDNAVFIGNDSSHIENDFNSDATWNHSSDVRQKTNIKDDTLGLDFISNLRTVTYTHKSPSEFPKEWTAYDPEDTTPMGGGKTIHGFIAQEVKEALDIAGCNTFGGWSVDPDGRQRVSFEAFVMPLIRAVQEQQAQINELRAELDKKSDK